MREGEDLKQAIESFIKEENIQAATVISAVGSLNNAAIRMAGASASVQDVRNYNGPFEIVSLMGNLGQNRTHLHMAISDTDGKVTGGHVKEGCTVHTTVEVVIAVTDDLIFAEEADHETGFNELKIETK